MESSDTERPSYDLFLSHNSADKPIVEALARALWARHGIRAWVDKWDLPLGRPWQDELLKALRAVSATAVCIGPNGVGRWQKEELQIALDEASRDPKRIVIPVLLPKAPSQPQISGFLLQRTWENLEQDWDEGVARIARALRPHTAPPSNRGARCPYRGLEPFREEDARWFYGRRAQVSALLKRLRSKEKEDYFIVVAGASGSGKSSLVRAGLVPSVRTGELDSSYAWQILVIRPGRNPCQRLAQELVDLDAKRRARDLSLRKRSDEIDELAQQLRERPDGLSRALDTILGADGRLMLVVDQLEEVFTIGGDEHGPTKESAAFLQGLLSVTEAGGDGRTRVVTTLRADFLERCLGIPALATRLQSAVHFALLPLSEEELREVIVEPARSAGCDVDPTLVEELVRAVRHQPGNLPLLQFTLHALWNSRTSEQLTHESYRQLGRLEDAVTQYADGVVREAERQGQLDYVRRVFLRLVHVNVATPNARRTSSVQEFGHDPNEMKALDLLTEARLVTRDEETVDLAHEILLREWKQLQHWLNGDPEALRVQQRLSDAARDWDENRRASSYLWTGPRLTQVLELLSANRLVPTRRERAFIDAAQNRAHQRRLLQIAAVFLLVGVSATTFSLWRRAESATTQVRNTLHTSLLQEARAQCRDLLPGTRERGLEALRAAVEIRPDPAIRSAYIECLLRPGLSRLPDEKTDTAPQSNPHYQPRHEAAGILAQARRGEISDQVEFWTEKAGAQLNRWTAQARDVDSVHLSGDGRIIAATLYQFGHDNQVVKIWDIQTGAEWYSLTGEVGSLGHMTYSPWRLSFAERYLAVAGHSGSVFAWDLWTIGGSPNIRVPPRRALATRPFADEALATAISPDGRWVAALGDQELVVLELETGAIMARDRLADHQLRQLKWTDASTIRLGSQSWHWTAPVDQGFFVRANQGRSREINAMAFDRQGHYLGITSEYNGGPTIVEFGGTSPTIRMRRTDASMFEGEERLAFSPKGELCSLGWGCEPCGTEAQDANKKCNLCLSPQDFKRGATFRCDARRITDATFAGEDLMATGKRESVRLHAIDWPSGQPLWSHTVPRSTLGALSVVYSEQGDVMVSRTSDQGKAVFEAIRTRTGDSIKTARAWDDNYELQPIFMNGQPAFLYSTNVSVHLFEGPTPIRGPHRSTDSDGNAQWHARGNLAIERGSKTGITVWDLHAGRRCAASTASAPRTPASVLSESTRLLADYDGHALTVWHTANCSVAARLKVEAVEDVTLTPDDLTLRYLGPDRRMGSVVIGTPTEHHLTPPLELEPGCVMRWGSGFSQDGAQYYTACGSRSSGTQLQVRVWNTDTGHLLKELKVPLATRDEIVSASLDPSFRTLVVATQQEEGGLWRVAREGSSDTSLESCPNVSIRPTRYGEPRFLGGGRLLAWTEAVHQEVGAEDAGTSPQKTPPVLLRAIEPSGCSEVMSLKLEHSRFQWVDATPSGGVAVALANRINAYGRDGQVEWSALQDAIGNVEILSAALSSDGSRVAAALRSGFVVVGVPGESAERWRFTAGPGKVTSLVFSPDARWLTAGTSDGRVHLWDLKSIEAQLETAGLGWQQVTGSAVAPAH